MTTFPTVSVETIDACLPQTQCQQCGYKGCLPYAVAIQTGEAKIDQCAPGGLKTLERLSQLLQIDAAPYREHVQSRMQLPHTVKIDEQACIGCTKCLQACPVDAIVGASKQMHTIIQDDCTGCELCIEPCPVDCISIVPSIPKDPASETTFQQLSKLRYQQRQKRLQQLKTRHTQTHQEAKKQSHQDYIAAARARVTQKRKLSKCPP